MLGEVLRPVFAYTRETMAHGSMWILPLAPGVPERLIVGNERAFFGWFFEGKATIHKEVFTPTAVDEYHRTFNGAVGVLGSMGVYRAAFTSIDQTKPLARRKVTVPVIALGSDHRLGYRFGEMVMLVADNGQAHTLPDCGHFLPEERPDFVTRHILSVAAKLPG